MAREIDFTQESFTEDEKAYIRQRPWLITPDVQRKLDDEEADQEGSEEAESSSYEEMSVNDLRRELKARDLDYSKANKEELIHRLEMADAEE